METPYAMLSQQELLALALEATRRGDSGHSLGYLKEACARSDASPQAHFLLGSEFAQISLRDQAFAHMARALELAPDFAIARFQLGLLCLTSGQADQAMATWAALSALGAEHPLVVFKQGLEHLIRDEFADCIQHLERGIALNTENAALNTDMQQVIDRVRALPPGASPAPTASPTTADATEEKQSQSHLFLSAYTGGKVH